MSTNMKRLSKVIARVLYYQINGNLQNESSIFCMENLPRTGVRGKSPWKTGSDSFHSLGICGASPTPQIQGEKDLISAIAFQAPERKNFSIIQLSPFPRGHQTEKKHPFSGCLKVISCWHTSHTETAYHETPYPSRLSCSRRTKSEGASVPS